MTWHAAGRLSSAGFPEGTPDSQSERLGGGMLEKRKLHVARPEEAEAALDGIGT